MAEYQKKENLHQSLALERWAVSQGMNPTDLLYASLRLVAAQFLLVQANELSPADKMLAELDKVQEVVGLVFKAMVKDIIISVVEPK